MGLLDAVANSSPSYGRGLVRGANKKPTRRRRSSSTGRTRTRTRTRTYSNPPAPPAPPPVYTPPVYTGSTGSYSRPKAVPSASSGPVKQIKPPKPPPPPPPPPSIKEWLAGDNVFQDTRRNLRKARSDLRGDVTRRRGIVRGDYQDSRRALKEQRGGDLEDLEEDFASRGLLKSGLYAGEVGDYEEEFAERLANLGTKKTQAIEALQQELDKFKSANKLRRQSAREQAVRRRAEKFDLG